MLPLCWKVRTLFTVMFIRFVSLVFLVLLLAPCLTRAEQEKLVPMTLYSGVWHGSIRGSGMLTLGETAQFEAILVNAPEGKVTRGLVVSVDGLDRNFEKFMDLSCKGESTHAMESSQGTFRFEVPLPADNPQLRAIIVNVRACRWLSLHIR